MRKIRCGGLSFANALPLQLALHQPTWQWTFAVPTQINAQLVAQQLDGALLSAAAYLQHRNSLILVPEVTIAAQGYVGSVGLFLPAGSSPAATALAGVQQIALPTTSATSIGLAKIVVEKFWGYQPTYSFRTAPLSALQADEVGAALLIGDAALWARQQHPTLTYIDLGEVWHQVTGLPMVYAVVAIRRAFWQAHPAQARLIAEAWQAAAQQPQRQAAVAWASKRWAAVGWSTAAWQQYFQHLSFTGEEGGFRGLFTFDQWLQKLSSLPATNLWWLAPTRRGR